MFIEIISSLNYVNSSFSLMIVINTHYFIFTSFIRPFLMLLFLKNWIYIFFIVTVIFLFSSYIKTRLCYSFQVMIFWIFMISGLFIAYCISLKLINKFKVNEGNEINIYKTHTHYLCDTKWNSKTKLFYKLQFTKTNNLYFPHNYVVTNK